MVKMVKMVDRGRFWIVKMVKMVDREDCGW